MRIAPATLFRILILTTLWGLMTYIAYQHQQRGGGPEGVATVHALCPFGGMATLYKAVADGEYVRRTQASALILLGGTVLLALILRRAFCGWICPLGAMQEFFGRIGKRLGIQRKLHENAADKALRWLKYPILALILIFTYITAELVFSPYDPWAAYAHISAGFGEISEEFLIGFIMLLVSVIGSAVIDRPFCRYLCPFGALLAPISKLGIVRVVRNEESCIHCGKCDAACPVDIRVEAVPEVRTGECISCGKCVQACPVPGTLDFAAGKRRVSPLLFGILTVVIFFGVIAGTKAAGIWQSLPADLEEITTYGGTLDPTNIRGFLSLSEIEESYGVPAAAIIEKVGLPEDTSHDIAVKDLMEPSGREVEEIREAVRELTGYGANEASDAKPQSTIEQLAKSVTSEIKGDMSFGEVAQMAGIDADALLAELDLPEDTDRQKAMREILRPLGREVVEVRQAVTKLSPASTE